MRQRSALGQRFWALLAGGTLAGILIFAVVMIWRGGRGETIVLQVLPVDDPNVVRVYVGGEVTTPGLYALPRGSRVSDAVDAAGGATATGNVDGLGMASVVEDADQIIVPANRAIVAPTVVMPVSGGSGDATAEPAPASPSPVNINTATATELDILPGVGPAIAGRIIEYREQNGPFQTVDELAEVRGISERMVDEMRDMLTVGS